MKLWLFIFAISLICLRAAVTQACSLPPFDFDPYQRSWMPGTTPHVYMDDHFEQFNSGIASQLRGGIFNWNTWGLADCSFVEFTGGESTHLAAEVFANSFRAPAGTVYVVNIPGLNCETGGYELSTI